MDDSKRMNLEEKVQALAEELAATLGLEIVLVEIKGSGTRPIVRTYIDRPGGVTLEDCAHFSKRFSVVLDVEEPVPFSYTMEVSSPGLDRPLVKEADFLRFTGKNGRVRTRCPVDGQKNFKGRILGVTQGRVELELAPGRKVGISVQDIEKANLMIEI
jgi:ribosome maturation factor RimP